MNNVTGTGNIGNYNDIWNSYLNDEKIEIPEFVSHKLEIKTSPNKGRGLFATEEIESGEIIMITKATFYIDISSKECIGDTCLGEQFKIEDSYYQKIFEEVKNNKISFIRVKDMCNGSDNNNSYPSVDINIYKPNFTGEDYTLSQNHEISIEELRKIEAFNAFEDEGNLNKISRKCKHSSAHGLWCLAAYINHSCRPNSERIFLNEFMLVQSTKKIQKDEEVFWRYCPNLAYPIRQQYLSKYGFTCNCAHCQFGPNTQALFKLTNTINMILRKFQNQDFTAFDIVNYNLVNILKKVEPEVDIETMNNLLFILKSMNEVSFENCDISDDEILEDIKQFKISRVDIYRKILNCNTFTGPNYFFNIKEIGNLGIKENNQEIIDEYKIALGNFQANNAEIFDKYYEKLYMLL